MWGLSAVFVRYDQGEEVDLGQHQLASDTLELARAEALRRAPSGAERVKICCDGVVIQHVQSRFTGDTARPRRREASR